MVMSGVSGTYGIISIRDERLPPRQRELRRISRRAAAVSPSATLAVDAKAKALQAAGEHVIGFGAGEPDFPTPAHIVEAAVAACRDPANHHYTPTGGIPAPARGHRGQDAAGLGPLGHAPAGAGDQRGQAGRRQRLRRAVRPGRRGHRPGPVLDDLSRVDRPGRRRPGAVLSDETQRVPLVASRSSRRPARRGPRRSSSSRHRTPPARSTHAKRSRRSAVGRSSTVCGC